LVRKNVELSLFFLLGKKRFINKMKFQILEKTAKEYFQSAEDELNKHRNNAAVVLYFKCLVALIDLYILQKTGITVSSHTKRFKLLKSKFPQIYNILDKDFPFPSKILIFWAQKIFCIFYCIKTAMFIL